MKVIRTDGWDCQRREVEKWKGELLSWNGKINSKKRPKVTTNAYNNNEKRREGQDHDFMEYSFGELEKEEGPGGGWVGG